MKIEEAFGIIMKKHRLSQNLSQEKLAELCSLDRTYISLLERGMRTPTLKTIFLVSESLSLRPNHLVQEVEKLVYEDPEI